MFPKLFILLKSVVPVAAVWLTLTLACSKSPYPGYTKIGGEAYFCLHRIGEDTTRALPGDFITVNLAYLTPDDSAFFKGTRRLRLLSPAFAGSVDECFATLAEGDSATFILSATGFFEHTLGTSTPRFLKGSPIMKISVGMSDIQPSGKYEEEKQAFLSWISDFGAYEKVVLQQFLREQPVQATPTASGIYCLVLRPGQGPGVIPGDTVTVHYEGRFLNGRFFDSTIRRSQPFQFVYGTEMQVIEGLHEAIGMMHEGERSLFILPSEQAFGGKGSSSGIIPPFTSLIFEVELLKVSSPNKM